MYNLYGVFSWWWRFGCFFIWCLSVLILNGLNDFLMILVCGWYFVMVNICFFEVWLLYCFVMLFGGLKKIGLLVLGLKWMVLMCCESLLVCWVCWMWCCCCGLVVVIVLCLLICWVFVLMWLWDKCGLVFCCIGWCYCLICLILLFVWMIFSVCCWWCWKWFVLVMLCLNLLIFRWFVCGICFILVLFWVMFRCCWMDCLLLCFCGLIVGWFLWIIICWYWYRGL